MAERDALVEAVAHALCPHLDSTDEPCAGCPLAERGPHGGVRRCMHYATQAARTALAAIEAAGWRVVPVEKAWQDLRGGPGQDFPCEEPAMVRCAQPRCQKERRCRLAFPPPG